MFRERYSVFITTSEEVEFVGVQFGDREIVRGELT